MAGDRRCRRTDASVTRRPRGMNAGNGYRDAMDPRGAEAERGVWTRARVCDGQRMTQLTCMERNNKQHTT